MTFFTTPTYFCNHSSYLFINFNVVDNTKVRIPLINNGNDSCNNLCLGHLLLQCNTFELLLPWFLRTVDTDSLTMYGEERINRNNINHIVRHYNIEHIVLAGF